MKKEVLFKKTILRGWHLVCLYWFTFIHLPSDSLAQVAFSPNTWSGIATGVTNFPNVPAGDCGGAVFTNMHRGPGLTATTATNGYNSAGFNTTSYAAADLDDYVWFKITASTAPVTIDSLVVILARSSTGPSSVTFNYRMNSNANATPATQVSALVVNPTTTTATGAPYTFIPASPIVVPAGDSIFFRMVGWNGGGSGSLRIMNGSAIYGSEDCTTNSIVTSGWSPAPFCISSTSGASIVMPFIATGTINPGNDYHLQFSSSPSFSASTVLGSLTGSTASTGNVSGAIPAGTSAGTYYVRIVSTNPAINGNAVVITTVPDINAVSTLTQVSCYGNNNGAIDMNVTNGTSPFTHHWSNGMMTEDVSGLAPGTYTDTIADANGCKMIQNFTITQPAVLSWSSTIAHVSCNGSGDGEASASLSGGTLPYTYSWTNSSGDTLAMSEDISGLTGGTYVIQGEDGNGCTTSDTVTINEPALLSVSQDTLVHATCGTCADGSVTVTINGGTAPYTILWSNSDADVLAENLLPGSYCANITDANGCTASECHTIGFTTGIEVVNHSTGPSVFPNPSNGKDVTVLIPANKHRKVSFSLYDASGKRAMHLSELDGNTEQRVLIPANVFNDSIYFFRIATDEHKSIGSGKIIMTR